MTQSYPAYQLTCADIDRLKVISARIFDRRVSPQTRLEIIARSSGFNTFAAMKAALKEGPVRLVGDQHLEENHIRKSGINQAHVPFINGVSLNEIIAAGLAWSERDDPEWSATKPVREKLKRLKRDGGTLHKYLEFLTCDVDRCSSKARVFRSSLTWADVRDIQAEIHNRKLCEEVSVIIATPENAAALTYDFDTEEPAAVRPDEWRCARVRLTKDDRFFEIPPPEEVPWTDRNKLEALISDARIVVFDENDLDRVKKQLEISGVGPLADYRFRAIKQETLELENESEGTFFSLGYYGTCRNDRPEKSTWQNPGVLSNCAFVWMCELLNLVHGCAYEFASLTNSRESAVVDEPSDPEWSRLIVDI